MSGVVKYFSSNDINSPSLTADWSALIGVLDGCLITGFNHRDIASITVDNKVAVITFNSNHDYKQFQVIKITGASNTKLNNEFKILGVTPNTVEFTVDLPNLTETGAISASLAPLGWSKPFSTEGKGVYRAKNITENPFYLRVDSTKDPLYTTTHAKFAKVGILEACSDIDDLPSTQAPYDSVNPDKNWVGANGYFGWSKWRYATSETAGIETQAPTASIRSWILIGDDTNFYIVLKNTLGSKVEAPYGFGVIHVNSEPRPFLIADIRYALVTQTLETWSPLANPSQPIVACLYDYYGTLANEKLFRVITGFGGVRSGSAANTYGADPIKGYWLTPFFLIDPGNMILGELPLVACSINNLSSIPSNTLYRDDGEAYITRSYAINLGAGTANEIKGTLLFKIYEG